MITKVKVAYFKQFEDHSFDLSEHIVLAGPNNSGKTTLLQAIAVWNMALQRWKEKREGSTARRRTGVPITRQDFTALPLREMNLLWTNTLTALRKDELEKGQKLGQPRVMSITLGGQTAGEAWELTFEFRFQNTELLYARPAHEHQENLPKAAQNFIVVHVPPFSGIGAEETGLDRPYQDRLIGQGKAGDILRNLLLEVYLESPAQGWPALVKQIEEIFRYRLLPPQYERKAFILCEYLRGIPKTKGKDGLAQLDIASAGSGFHQVLLLLGFFFARPASVLLLDEPDAHQHVVLQKQMYDRLRRIASERSCQLILATHSEVLIDSTSPEQILSFYEKPHLLVTDVQRAEVREALKRLTATDLLLAETSPGVLYLEGETDLSLLSAWARTLNHPLARWFSESPFWHSNQGRNPQEAKGHFFALRAIKAGTRGCLLLDGDNRGLPDREVGADGLTVTRWRRYESESYLLHPEALVRYVATQKGPLFATAARNHLRDQLPPAVLRDPVGDHQYLGGEPVSKTLLPGVFKASDLSITKHEYYLIAGQMLPDEIHPEVREKLDLIQASLGL